MKTLRIILALAVPLLCGLLLAAAAVPVSAQTTNDLGAFVGRWQLNPAGTKLLKYGPNGKNDARAANYTFIFARQDRGLKLDMYNQYPQAVPSRSIDIVADRKPHICDHNCIIPGVQSGQTYTFSMIDAHLLVRATHVYGKLIEFNTYAVSADSNTFTMITWSPDTPEWQNIYVFDRQPAK